MGRRWTAEEKGRIVAESFEEGANISDAARRHGVVRGLLTVWRRQVSLAMAAKGQGFVPVRIVGRDAAGGTAVSGKATFLKRVEPVVP
jgi:transposase